MSARTIGVYSLKGGVGKTTLAVNLAWASATLSSRRTLLWDLDGQAASTWILGHDPEGREAGAAIRREVDARRLVRPTAIERLDLLPADASLRELDVAFHALDKKNRLARLVEDLGRNYERIVIDCPPGLTDTSDQIMRAADLVVVPVIPSALSRRALDTIAAHVQRKKGPKVTLAPVFSMVDRRRALHRDALVQHPDWPTIPMASAFETMTERRAPLGAFASRISPGVEAVSALWRRIESALSALK
ncbi:ParA family protein [Sphingomonas jeddahensis]|uniref:Sporulation initiation inhibitor protein Soj n=1 Tax=Sphingomonas jeddahensis TaxID=1915074 RepID=A0A1V2EWV5_9SPHN|nr:ParA family protein [Sphingomonas jeddahensis]ONF96634.1 Sporulation initiation inhibitor protein Soj [Sphingomonas jeddahensis]